MSAGPALRVIDGSFHHRLTFALRFDDHFLRRPIEEDLDLFTTSPGGRVLRPLPAPSPARYRHGDGTYRFVDLPDGNYPISFRSPAGGVVSWDPPLSVAAPLADPRTAVARDLWPSAQAAVPSGMTALRGKLAGVGANGLKIEIAGAADAFDRFTRADATGEFLFPLPARVKPETDGRIKLKARVAGGAKTVASIDVLSGKVESFVGANFLILSGQAIRARFNFT